MIKEKRNTLLEIENQTHSGVSYVRNKVHFPHHGIKLSSGGCIEWAWTEGDRDFGRVNIKSASFEFPTGDGTDLVGFLRCIYCSYERELRKECGALCENCNSPFTTPRTLAESCLKAQHLPESTSVKKQRHTL